eukprot:3236262-Heterocapsa_arctica.AAC.1
MPHVQRPPRHCQRRALDSGTSATRSPHTLRTWSVIPGRKPPLRTLSNQDPPGVLLIGCGG